MKFSLLGVALFCGLFFGMLIFFEIGRRFTSPPQDAIRQHGLPVIRGAIFGLMALLVAFTFANANAKFDLRRTLIIDEANAIGTTYLRLDLLPQPVRASLQTSFRNYLNARLQFYKNMANNQPIDSASMLESKMIQKNIWTMAINGCELAKNPTTCSLLLPSINKMIEIADTRLLQTKMHISGIIFFILLMVAFLTAALAGHSTAGKDWSSSLHILSYAIIMAITIYLIIDLEYPRFGMINFTASDAALIDIRANMAETRVPSAQNSAYTQATR